MSKLKPETQLRNSRAGTMLGKFSGAWSKTALLGGLVFVTYTAYSSSLPLQPRLGGEEQASPLGWKPKTYGFKRYQGMIRKSPFGKVPIKVPLQNAVKQEQPPGKNNLVVAAVSIVEGKPIVFLLNNKTEIYQRVDTVEENEHKIRLLEIRDAHYPRDVMAKVLIDGRLTELAYDKNERVGGTLPKHRKRSLTQNRVVKRALQNDLEEEDPAIWEEAAFEAIKRTEDMAEEERMAETRSK